MSHEILEEMVVSANGISMWHYLGHVYPAGVKVEATAALNQHIQYDVREEPLTLATGMSTGYKAIVRSATPGDPNEVVFGIVADPYQLLTNRTLVTMYDQHVRDEHGATVGIETMGALKDGAVFFMTVPLPSFTIDGDEIRSWMLVENDMTGKKGVNVEIVNERVVCANTLLQAHLTASESHMIAHGRNVFDDTREWMKFLYERNIERQNTIREAYAIMAQRDVAPVEVEEYTDSLYGDPIKPDADSMPESVFLRRLKRWEYDVKRFGNLRGALSKAWAGDMAGYEDKAPHSAWDLYQAATWVESHYTSRQQSSYDLSKAILTGDRRDRIEKSFALAYAFTK